MALEPFCSWYAKVKATLHTTFFDLLLVFDTIRDLVRQILRDRNHSLSELLPTFFLNFSKQTKPLTQIPLRLTAPFATDVVALKHPQ